MELTVENQRSAHELAYGNREILKTQLAAWCTIDIYTTMELNDCGADCGESTQRT